MTIFYKASPWMLEMCTQQVKYDLRVICFFKKPKIYVSPYYLMAAKI